MEKHTKMNFISKALTALALSATVSTSAFAADSVNTTGLAVTDTTVKVGILHSITGTMALSEAGSVQAEKLAIGMILNGLSSFFTALYDLTICLKN